MLQHYVSKFPLTHQGFKELPSQFYSNFSNFPYFRTGYPKTSSEILISIQCIFNSEIFKVVRRQNDGENSPKIIETSETGEA